MNDLDEYDFTASDSSCLSAIFQREDSVRSESNSLVYRPPKQPNEKKQNDGNIASNERKIESKTNTSKSYYKFINLFRRTGSENESFGQYIICLLQSSSKNSELLIYQTKSKLLIRCSVKEVKFSKIPSDECSLKISISNVEWISTFKNEKELTEFGTKLCEFGGKIMDIQFEELKQEIYSNSKNENHDGILTQNLYESTELKNTVNNSIVEKEDILARLAKMGLPQIPQLQRKDDTNADSKQSDSLLIVRNNSESKICENNERSLKLKTHIQQTYCDHKYMGDASRLQYSNVESSSDGMQLTTWHENPINNYDLLKQISLLTFKVNQLTQEKLENDQSLNKLTSKLRVYQVKAENVERELIKCKEDCETLRNTNEELISKLKMNDKDNMITQKKIETSIQTEYSNESLNEMFRIHLNEISKFVYHLPLKTKVNDSIHVQNLRDNIENENLSSIINPLIDIVEERLEVQKLQLQDDTSQQRKRFIEKVKLLMSDMYSYVIDSSNCDNMDKTKIIRKVRSTTSEIVNNYDNCIEKLLEHFQE